MRMNCLLAKSIGRSWSAALVLALGAFQSLLAGRAEAQGFWFHRGTTYRSSVVMTSSGQGLNLAPGTMMTTQGLNLSPFTFQALTLTPMITGQSLNLSPNTLSLSPQSTFFVTSGMSSGATLTLAPQSTFQLVGGTNTGATLSLAPLSNGALTLSLSGGSPTADQGLQVLTLGFKNDSSKVNGFLQNLNTKLEALIGTVGKNLSKEDLTDLLMAAAKKALPGSGFGFLVDPVVEMFLKPVIDKLVGDRLPAGTNPSTPATGQPANGIPSGGMSFTVTGTITLTPASGGTTTPGGVPPGTTSTPSTPGDLKKDPGGSAAPAIGGP